MSWSFYGKSDAKINAKISNFHRILDNLKQIANFVRRIAPRG